MKSSSTAAHMTSIQSRFSFDHRRGKEKEIFSILCMFYALISDEPMSPESSFRKKCSDEKVVSACFSLPLCWVHNHN